MSPDLKLVTGPTWPPVLHPEAVSLRAVSSTLRAVADACDALVEGRFYRIGGTGRGWPVVRPGSGLSCEVPDAAAAFVARWLRDLRERNGDRWACGGCRQWQAPGTEPTAWVNTNQAGPSPLCEMCAEHARPDPVEYDHQEER